MKYFTGRVEIEGSVENPGKPFFVLNQVPEDKRPFNVPKNWVPLSETLTPGETTIWVNPDRLKPTTKIIGADS